MSPEFHIKQIVQLKSCADGLCNEQLLSPLPPFQRRAGASTMAQLDANSCTRLPVLPLAVVEVDGDGGCCDDGGGGGGGGCCTAVAGGCCAGVSWPPILMSSI